MTTENITGRDDYIQVQSLIYAIACIQNLPKRRQERSNMIDMCRIVRASFEPEDLAYLAHDVEGHLDREIDLFPDYDPEDEDEDRPEGIVEYGARYDTQIIALRGMRARILAGDIAAPEERIIDFQSEKLKRQHRVHH